MIVRYLVMAFILLPLCIAGCVYQEVNVPDNEIDPDAFVGFFDGQRRCMEYLNSLARPAMQKLAEKDTIEKMRVWVSLNIEDGFSKLVKQVQYDTAKYGRLDPFNESDQAKVLSRVFYALKSRVEFEDSSCGPDVQELLGEVVYFGLGGDQAPVMVDIRERGAWRGREERRVLLTMLMAGAIVSADDVN